MADTYLHRPDLLLPLMAGDTCGNCGTERVDGARFCHVCGERFDDEAIDFDIYGINPSVVRSSGPSTAEPSRKRMLAAMFALAAVFLGGLAVFSWVTSDGSPAADPSLGTTIPPGPVTSSTSVAGSTSAEVAASVLEVGDPLVWHHRLDLAALSSVGIDEYAGQLLVFATESNPRLAFSAPGSGLVAWRSDDGVAWESLGTVIDPANEMASVAASADGMVALGRNSEGAAAIWRSGDGSNWQMELLPETESLSRDEPIPRMSASGTGVEVIVGYSDFEDPARRVLEAIQEVTDASVGEFGITANLDGASTEIVVTGPFRLPLMSLSADELGLSEDEMNRVVNGGSRTIATVWSSAEGGDWQVSTLGQIVPASLSVTPDGRFMMTGFGPSGNRIWVSDQGVEWHNPSTRLNRPSSIVRWRQSLIGAGFEITGDLALSQDGIVWQPIGVAGMLPGGHVLNVSPVSAGDDGVAATAVQFLIGSELDQRQSEAILVKDEFTLTAHDSNNVGDLVLSRGDEVLATFSVYSMDQSALVADLAERTVTFVDPTTSEPYATFTIDELRQLESAAGRDLGPAYQRNSILFSHDTMTWSITDVADLAIGKTSVSAMQVTSLGLVAGITRIPNGPLSSTNRPITQIYIAEYPS